MDVDTFGILARSIAQELTALDPNSNWQLSYPEDRCYVTLSNVGSQEKISLHIGPRIKTLNIHACWPRSFDGTDLRPYREGNFNDNWYSLNCSYSKEPVVIARDIIRRLLTSYRDALNKLLQQDAIRASDEKQQESIAKELSEALGIIYNHEKRSRHSYHEVSLPYNYCPKIDRVDIEIASTTRVEIRLSTTHDPLVKDIVGVIRTHMDSLRQDAVTVAKRFAILRQNMPGLSRAALDQFVIENWDAEHMGPLPDNTDTAVRIFTEYQDHMEGKRA